MACHIGGDEMSVALPVHSIGEKRDETTQARPPSVRQSDRERKEGAPSFSGRPGQRHLALAETHVIQGEQHIAKQTRILAEMECGGHEKASQQARELLATFELTHTSHVEDRDRIKADFRRVLSVFADECPNLIWRVL